eukprot:TRINITY_DN109_c1_g2_i1.p1 TRINITY_DN109_c1_g2~~TRINITY_DN109_c1_g2_i1.p1  ORF type:complete len:148 (+),score=21.82 TRINITY_DN109_c1_g2_i1:202-645(+)
MAAIFLVLCIIFVWYKNRPLDLSILPEPVRWQYEQYLAKPSAWSKDKSNKFFKKQLSHGSEEYQRMLELFHGFLGAPSEFEITEAYAIFNPLLVTSFLNYRHIITSRMVDTPQIFAKQDWKKTKQAKAKELVYNKYLERFLFLPRVT